MVCKMVCYCGVEHQRGHWKVHKVECKAFAASRGGGQRAGLARRQRRVRWHAGGRGGVLCAAPGPDTAAG